MPRHEVSPQTALLFHALEDGGPIPGYFLSLPGAEKRLERLLLNQILEVEVEGRFLAGQAARQVLGREGPPIGEGPLARLAVEGLRYAEALGDLGVSKLMLRIYQFGRRPLVWKPGQDSQEGGSIGFISDAALNVLDEHFTYSPSSNLHWAMWRPLRPASDGGPARFKLYLSPSGEDLAAILPEAVRILGESAGVKAFKLARGAEMLSRPDRLVAYFSRLDDLQQASSRLYDRLQGCRVHGVPFTAAISDDGLLSWGADPERRTGQVQSWRLWIAHRLSLHFKGVRRAALSSPLWPSVLELLRFDGVDPTKWAPTPDFWTAKPS